jgi:hypothetical protein
LEETGFCSYKEDELGGSCSHPWCGTNTYKILFENSKCRLLMFNNQKCLQEARTFSRL